MKHLLNICLSLAIILAFPSFLRAQNSNKVIHYNAFSHNDYWREHPLTDALDLGFNCVEADLWEIDDELYVSHEQPEADVMVDFKQNGEEIYRLLKKMVEPYREYFCRMDNGEYREGAILLFISGDRPMRSLPEESTRVAFLDGKLAEIGKGIPTTLMPVVSDNYADFFTWKGEGEMPADELARMRKLIQSVHAEDKLFRWWGAPDTETFKRLFLHEGVDLLGADNLEELVKIL